VLRWNGSAWKAQSMPGDGSGYTGLQVFGASDAWLTGYSTCVGVTKASHCSTPLWHWNGASWQEHQVGTDVSSMAGSSDKNLWLVGYVPLGAASSGVISRPYAYQWTGTSWSYVHMPHPLSKGAPPSVDTTSSSNVWIGTSGINRNPRIGGTRLALHWDGKKWAELQGMVGSPVIDEPLGVWFSMFYYWTPEGGMFPQSPSDLDGWWASEMTVPGTTTLIAVGNQPDGKDKTRGFIAACGPLP
jgi:hypothetical protein